MSDTINLDDFDRDIVYNFDHFYYSMYLNGDKEEDKLKKIALTIDTILKLVSVNDYLGCTFTISDDEKKIIENQTYDENSANLKKYSNDTLEKKLQINNMDVKFYFKQSFKYKLDSIQHHIEKLK